MIWVVYRFFDPSINSTEKPMDFAFLNASILARYFPPEDPWLRGHDLPYYYFGYLMMGNLTELTFIPSRISYNLALALIPAMAGMAAFGLVYNLARSHGASTSRGMGFALVAPALLLMVSNLLGALGVRTAATVAARVLLGVAGRQGRWLSGDRRLASDGAPVVVAQHEGNRHPQRGGR